MTTDVSPPSHFQLLILAGMQRKPIYFGTADPAVVQKRRARNKVAAKSRRANRAA